MNIINKFFLILFVTLAASPLFSQSDLPFGFRKPETAIDTFVRKVEGAGNLAASIQVADGGYVTISGSEYYATSFLVRRIKASGQKVWERTLNFDKVTYVQGIAQTTDEGVLLAGFDCEGDYCDQSRPILIKLRPNGIVAWKKGLVENGEVFPIPVFSSVIATSDGGVISIGSIGSVENRLLLLRLNSTGDVVWGKSLGGFSGARYYFLKSVATLDHGFIVAFPTISGKTNSKGIGIVKITNSGDVVWGKSITADDFVFQSAGITADNGIILVGKGTSSKKLKVVTLKADGTLSRRAEYSLKVSGHIQSVSSPIQTPDGGYAITASSNDASATKSSTLIVKIDSSRKVAFRNSFGASGESVFATADDGFVLFGSIGESLLVSKVNSEGTVPGCNFFQQLGTTTRAPLSPLRIARTNVTESDDVPLEPYDFGLSSVATNHPVTTVCQ